MSAHLEVGGVRLRRGNRWVLDGVRFNAAPTAFIGVVGPNGAGKSSLLRLIAGLDAPEAGAVRLDGMAPSDLRAHDRALKLSYLPQSRPLYAAIDVEAVVALGRFAYGSPTKLDTASRAAVERAMAAADIADLRGRSAPSLSGGELARMHLARALAAETPALVADEPAAALDPKHQLAIMRLLRRKADDGGLVIAALHEVALARLFCTRIIFLREGRIAADGPPEEALADAAALYGLDAEEGRMLWDKA